MVEKVIVQVEIFASINKVWKLYTEPEYIMQWNRASEDWHTPSAENDLRAGGRFNIRMEEKNGSKGFDFTGVYDEVKDNELISYTLDDGRKVAVEFEEVSAGVRVTITFEPENEIPVETQKKGWQAILNNFRDFVEGRA